MTALPDLAERLQKAIVNGRGIRFEAAGPGAACAARRHLSDMPAAGRFLRLHSVLRG